MRITLDIKKNRLSTFLAFIKTLDYVSITENDIPQWQMDEAESRLADLEKHPEKAIDFDHAIGRIEKKYLTNGLSK